MTEELTCCNCGRPCKKIGELNRIGIKKEYCCRCFSAFDIQFTCEHWCSICEEYFCEGD